MDERPSDEPPPPTTAPEAKDERGFWVWTAIGCGALVLVGTCVVPPIVYLVATSEESPEGPIAPRPAPLDPTAPPVAPLPSVPGTDARRVTAVVEDVSGTIPGVRAGTHCAFDVVRTERPDGTFQCNAQIACGGQLLYGGRAPGGWYGAFECTLYSQPERHVVGIDQDTTSADGDAAMQLDTLRGTMTITDDGRGRLGQFSLRARVTGVS